MQQLRADKIKDGIFEVTFNDNIKNPSIQVKFVYPDRGQDGGMSFKHSDGGHLDFQQERESLSNSLEVLLELSEGWTLTKLKFDLDDLTIKAKMERDIDGYVKPLKLTTPAINDLVLEEIMPLMEEAAKYVTGEKRQQSEMFVSKN